MPSPEATEKEDAQNGTEHPESEARAARELEDMKRPRVLGADGRSQLAEVDASSPTGAPVTQQKGVPSTGKKAKSAAAGDAFLGPDLQPGNLRPPIDKDDATRRIEFEKETILHVVRTERIRLQRVDGALVVPDHELISPVWRQHVPFLQFELAHDQRLIEQELQAFVRHIGSNAYEPKSKFSEFFHEVFEGDRQVKQALAARQ